MDRRAGPAALHPVSFAGPDVGKLNATEPLHHTDLWPQLARTATRAAIGTTMAMVTGVTLGLATGCSEGIDAFTRTWRAVLNGIPPIVTVVLVSLWAGIDGEVATWVVTVAIVPQVWIVTAEATRAVDPDLLEMAHGLRVPPWWRLTRLTIPAIVPPVRAVAALSAAIALRLTIMSEALGESDGIGAELSRARTVLDTPAVYTWALVAISAAVIVEFAALRVGRRRPRTIASDDRSRHPAGSQG